MLSFLIPAVSLLEKHRFNPRHGVGVIVLAPSRELAVEIFELASELLSGTKFTAGMVMEGSNRTSEEKKLEKGVNLLVATPKRFLEHLRETTSLVVKNTKGLYIYEATKFSEGGFEQDIKELANLLPKKGRSTAVFGSELTDELEGLSELVCQQETVHRYDEAPLRSGNTLGPQGYVLVEPENRLLLLISFLKTFRSKKIIVRCSSTSAAIFYSEMLNVAEVPNYAVHVQQNRKNRLSTYSQFLEDEQGTLICTEEVIRGLRIPPVDWNIQFDPPRSTSEYLKQTRLIEGRSVVFLQPMEAQFMENLSKTANITVEEFNFPKKKLVKIQPLIEKSVTKIYGLNTMAKDGFRAYLQEYNIHAEPKFFDSTTLDVAKLAKSFGFPIPPRVNVRRAEEAAPVDKIKRPYGPERIQNGKKRKIQ
ncbi:P-loop containing nucleoside triphosphate hydrolase protein [Geopyxis carbonaria]|nr:P-loop containing nucleoside triphosphate hydrolase protein [Geopyxis carbonaria]